MRLNIHTTQKQMSESYWTITFLTLSGGFQDAYSYFARGKVFANAATGNVILMAAKLFEGDLGGFAHYLIPLCFFCAGIAASKLIKNRFAHHRIHWRQMIVALEILLLSLTPWIASDLLANSMISFACAMQVQSFRKVHGLPFNSTMTVANIRNIIDHLMDGLHDRDRRQLHIAGHYSRILLTFFLGAGIGKCFVDLFGLNAVYGSSLLLFGGWLMMTIHPSVLSREVVSAIDEQ